MKPSWPRYGEHYKHILPESRSSITLKINQAMSLGMDLFKDLFDRGALLSMDSSDDRVKLDFKGLSTEKYKEYCALFAEEVGEENIRGSYRVPR